MFLLLLFFDIFLFFIFHGSHPGSHGSHGSQPGSHDSHGSHSDSHDSLARTLGRPYSKHGQKEANLEMQVENTRFQQNARENLVLRHVPEYNDLRS